jgi:hypothetical protein
VRGSTADFVALPQIGDQRLDPPPASAPTLPPILMQVSEPAILANPTPYCAQGFPTAERCLTSFFKCVGARFVCWAATQVGNIAMMSTRVIFLISPFITIGLFEAIIGKLPLSFRLAGRPCSCEQTRLGFALIRFAECSAHCTSDGLVSPTLSPQSFFRLVYRPCTSEQTPLGFFLQCFAVRTALCTPEALLCAKREQSIRVRMVLPSARQRGKGPIKVCRPKNLVGIASSTLELPAATRAMMGHSETN